MCTYNITVSDNLIERVRPVIGADTDISQWMQRQVEALLISLAVTPQRDTKQYAPDLEAILAMPLLDNDDVGLNGEQARMDYYKEKYDL
ncbi:MAG: hypothetical protein IJU81_08900 [Bacteroidales bacterium]|nr:hypothetical protein [Bacteroidales bacterium]